MTEDEWQTGSRPGPMLDWLEANLCDSPRKKRLFVCSACRLGWSGLRPEVQRLVEAVEDVADETAAGRPGDAGRSRYHDALLSLWRVALTARESTTVSLAAYALHGVGRAGACLGAVADLGEVAAPADLADLLRELFGNPFRKPRWVGAGLRGRIDAWGPGQKPADLLLVREWLLWDDGLIVALAEGAHAERAWDRLPVLADALEEAGCAEPALLEHLRQPGPHTRGCWAVDVLLGMA